MTGKSNDYMISSVWAVDKLHRKQQKWEQRATDRAETGVLQTRE